MNLLSFACRLAAGAAVLVAVLGGDAAATAIDETPPPKVLVAPAMPAAGCATCNGAPAAGGCTSCGRGCGIPLFNRKKPPYVVQLCPGACFGYFQTQWHRWEDVCPLPYQGVDMSDAPRAAPGYVPQPLPPSTTPQKKPEGKGSDAPLPRPVNPMPDKTVPNFPPPPNLGKPN